jgi:hypothetical protein
MSPRKKELIHDRIAQLELEADNARIRRDFKTMASFRFLAVLTRLHFYGAICFTRHIRGVITHKRYAADWASVYLKYRASHSIRSHPLAEFEIKLVFAGTCRSIEKYSTWAKNRLLGEVKPNCL